MLMYGFLKIQGHDGYFKFLFCWILQKFCFIQSSILIRMSLLGGGGVHTCFTNITCYERVDTFMPPKVGIVKSICPSVNPYIHTYLSGYVNNR